MSDCIHEKAYAKLNLSLDVGKKRPDGFHDMLMVMQTVSLCDRIDVFRCKAKEITVSSNLPYIPRDERNLAVKAAVSYLDAVSLPAEGFHIRLDKVIPVGAGMAGGSSDAAAVLRALNKLCGSPMTLAELEVLAAQVGSDVAFCVAGGTALAQGRGELLTPLPDMPSCGYLICKPDFSISTPELFRRLDEIKLRRHPDTNGILEALNRGDLQSICRRMYNVFEDIDDRRMRTVRSIKQKLLDVNAIGSVMTGTGSAVFGVFASEAEAKNAERLLRRELGFCVAAVNVPRIVES